MANSLLRAGCCGININCGQDWDCVFSGISASLLCYQNDDHCSSSYPTGGTLKANMTPVYVNGIWRITSGFGGFGHRYYEEIISQDLRVLRWYAPNKTCAGNPNYSRHVKYFFVSLWCYPTYWQIGMFYYCYGPFAKGMMVLFYGGNTNGNNTSSNWVVPGHKDVPQYPSEILWGWEACNFLCVGSGGAVTLTPA